MVYMKVGVPTCEKEEEEARLSQFNHRERKKRRENVFPLRQRF